MTWLYVLLAVLLVLFLILMLRVGSVVEYGENGFQVLVRIGVFKITVFPVHERKQKAKKPAKKKPKHEPEAEAHRGGDLDLFRELLRPFLRAASDTRGHLSIDLLYIDFTSAAENPATAAIAFGGASAALGALLAVLENCFTLKEREIHTRVDYSLKQPKIFARASFSLRLWQTLAISRRFGWQLLLVLRKRKREQKENQNTKTAAVKP